MQFFFHFQQRSATIFSSDRRSGLQGSDPSLNTILRSNRLQFAKFDPMTLSETPVHLKITFYIIHFSVRLFFFNIYILHFRFSSTLFNCKSLCNPSTQCMNAKYTEYTNAVLQLKPWSCCTPEHTSTPCSSTSALRLRGATDGVREGHYGQIVRRWVHMFLVAKKQRNNNERTYARTIDNTKDDP